MAETIVAAFTVGELHEIGDAVNKELRRYIAEGDREFHQRKFGTLTTLLSAISKINLQLHGAQPHWFADLEAEVNQLVMLDLLPTSPPGEFANLMVEFKARGMEPPVGNPQTHTWDRWEMQALLAGVGPDLAGLGRKVMREWSQHAWTSFDLEVSTRSGDSMIRIALSDPGRAHERWAHLLATDGERCPSLGGVPCEGRS